MINQDIILAAVEQVTGVTVDRILSRERSAEAFNARMIAVLAMSHQGYSSHQIAAAIERDCTNVRRALHNARRRNEASKLFREKYHATLTILNS